MLVLFALALRVFRLDLRSLWLDEAYSWKLAVAGFGDIVSATAHDIHPPLFYFLMHVWVQVFGTTEFALRSLSALCGALLLLPVYGLARSWANRPAAWWAAGLIACSPYFIELSRSARMAGLLALTCAASLYYFWKLLEEPNWEHALGYALSTLAALYTHYFAFLLLFSQHAYVFMGIGRLKLPRDVRKTWFLLQLVLLGGFTPWLAMLWQHVSLGGPGWRGVGVKWWEPLRALYSVWLGSACWSWWSKVVAVGGVGAGLAWSLWEWMRKRAPIETLLAPRVWGLLITLVLLPLGVVGLYSQFKLNVFDSRYLSVCGLAMVLMVSGFLAQASRRTAVLAGLLILAGFSVPLWNLYGGNTTYDDWRLAARTLQADQAAGRQVVVYPPWNVTPLDYYLPEGRHQGVPGNYDPLTGETAPYFEIDPTSVGRLKSLLPKGQRVYLVLVNAGETQDLLAAWFARQAPLRWQKTMGSIRMLAFEAQP